MQATISGKEVPLFVCQLTPKTVRRCACDFLIVPPPPPLRSGPYLRVQVWRATDSLFFARVPAGASGCPLIFGLRCKASETAGALAAAVERALEWQRDMVGLRHTSLAAQYSNFTLQRCMMGISGGQGSDFIRKTDEGSADLYFRCVSGRYAKRCMAVVAACHDGCPLLAAWLLLAGSVCSQLTVQCGYAGITGCCSTSRTCCRTTCGVCAQLHHVLRHPS